MKIINKKVQRSRINTTNETARFIKKHEERLEYDIQQ